MEMHAGLPMDSGNPNGAMGMPRHMPMRPGRELKVEDALLYLDQVKMEFSDKPAIYNEFLEIMKNFKAHEIDTPGVIDRVKSLFKGYNKLILGFNTFLPDGYKIELTPEEEANSKPLPSEIAAAQAAAAAAAAQAAAQAAQAAAAQAAIPKQPQQMQQQHAITYVTQIRNRFAAEPETYRQFLKILHTYQKEQRGIKDVLEQVSLLFADHPDLLMEFTYFLPDAVQDQAKERLNRAARESELRRQQRQAQAAAQAQPAMPQAVGAKRGRDTGRDERVVARDEYKKEPERRQRFPPRRGGKRKSDALGRDGSLLSAQGFHSIATERRFFDQVKDVLTAMSRDAWNEFVKCLELFSHDAISRKDMFALVQGLFGVNNADLFEEFKQILAARAPTDTSQQDLWYAIPLSEIDFSQCRKCTPSYRALPKDYPRPQSSARSKEEAAVLNDNWVSIPIGSEENYSFKHMRKNQYEEALFKCEDDRFEIDMIIDSNASTLRAVELLADEIAALKATEEATGHSAKFQYQLDLRSLSTIHLNSIARIYGDHGAEVLELLRKNPAGTIPVLLRRLKQKDSEWRKARSELNKQWKEVLEKNFHKSFDHRSFYFRQQDKKTYSVRHLVQEVKEPKSREDGDHGSVPMEFANSHKDVKTVVALYGDLRMEPQMILEFEDLGITKDIYRIMCHAAEHSGISVPDRERIAACWRDFLRLFYSIPVHAMYGAASAAPASNAMHQLDPAIAWAPNTKVLTSFGSGTVIEFRAADSMYVVQLPFGTAYLSPSAVIGPEELSENALKVLGVESTPDGREVIEGVDMNEANSAPHLLPPHQMFFGTQTVYIFAKLHHTLAERLVRAKHLAEQMRDAGDTGIHPLKLMTSDDSDTDEPEARKLAPLRGYSGFMSTLLGLLDGSIDNTRYEDACRHLLGNKSYVLYTLDKVIQQCLKHLQSMANDDTVQKLTALYHYHRNRKDGFAPNLYRAHVAQMLRDRNEDIYRIQLMREGITDVPDQPHFLKDRAHLLIEYQGGALLEATTNQAAALAAEDEEDFEDAEAQRNGESGSEEGSDHAAEGGLEASPGMAAMMAAARSQHAENGNGASMGWTPMSGALNRPGLGHPTSSIAESEMDLDGDGDAPSGAQALDEDGDGDGDGDVDSFSDDRAGKLAQDGLSALSQTAAETLANFGQSNLAGEEDEEDEGHEYDDSLQAKRRRTTD